MVIDGINGEITQAKDCIDAGNSGLVLRFMAGVAALGNHPITISGDHSICHQRPMKTMLDALNMLGAKAESINNTGFAPINIEGPMLGGKAFLNGQDAQPISALLISGALCQNSINLTVDDPGEKPWIDVTMNWLNRLGVKVTNDSYKKYSIQPSPIWKSFEYIVPGDWSQAAFPLGAALVTGSDLKVTNVNLQDLQGDKKIVEILKQMGANIETDDSSVLLKKSSLHGIDVNINDCIDTITILASIACFAKGTTNIYGTKVAKTKECNRVSCICEELKKMGARIQETEDGLIIEGQNLIGANVNSHKDHRMAMSLTIAALGAKGKTVIEDVDCVKKTYKNFPDDLKRIGVNIC